MAQTQSETFQLGKEIKVTTVTVSDEVDYYVRCDFIKGKSIIASFVIEYWKACCLSIYLHSFDFKPLSADAAKVISDFLEENMQEADTTVAYALDKHDGKFSGVAEQLGFIPVDTNFNLNSGNMVTMYKKVISWE